MASGISNAKGRRNSKTKASGFSRSKLGLVSKAGKRRPHNIAKDSSGNYVAAPFVPRKKDEVTEDKKQFIMTGEVRQDRITPKPTGAILRDGLKKIDDLENRMGKSMSDPYAFQRMRTHFRLGLLEV